jgi:hypothetical protein
LGLIVGIVGLLWGTAGLAQAGLFTMAQVWNLSGPERPGYLQRLGRAALFLGVLGLGVIMTTALTSLSIYSDVGLAPRIHAAVGMGGALIMKSAPDLGG